METPSVGGRRLPESGTWVDLGLMRIVELSSSRRCGTASNSADFQVSKVVNVTLIFEVAPRRGVARGERRTRRRRFDGVFEGERVFVSCT